MLVQFLGRCQPYWERLALETAVSLLLLAFIAAFALILAVIFRLERSPNLWAQLHDWGLGRPSRWSANLVGALVGLAWGFLLMGSVLQFDPDIDLGQINGLRLVTAVLAALGALLEDLIERGYLMNQMQRVNLSNWSQAILSALLFALYHTIWGFDPFAFVFSLIYGLILAGLFLWGKRSLTNGNWATAGKIAIFCYHPPMTNNLHTYLPQDRRRALARGESLPDRAHGSVLFADISGFIPFTEALRHAYGSRRGAEELSKHLDAVYTALIAEVERYGGSVTGFAGDAITCWFDEVDGSAPSRAVACAVALQTAMQAFAAISLPEGEVGRLTIKVGLATGEARRLAAGVNCP